MMSLDRQTTRLMQIPTFSENETARFAQALAPQIPGGTVITLQGTLGAGKTRFVQGFAAGLHIAPDQVVSPTFVLHQRYEGTLILHHFDVYRLRGPEDFWDLGAEEFFTQPNAICIVEWGDRIAECLPDRHLEINMRVIDWHQRCIEVNAVGSPWESIAQWAKNGSLSGKWLM